MPTTPEDRFYEPARIHGWFAVSSLLVFASLVGAVLADHYDRDWKRYQGEFIAIERKAANEALALKKIPTATQEEIDLAKTMVLEGGAEGGAVLSKEAFPGAVKAARANPNFRRAAAIAASMHLDRANALRTPEMVKEAKEHEAAAKAAEDARFKAEAEQRALKSEVDSLRYKRDEAVAHGAAETEIRRLTEEWSRKSAEEAGVHNDMDTAAALKEAKTKDARAVMAPVTEMEDRSRTLYGEAGVVAAERKKASLILGPLREAPLLPPLAPLLKIDQVVVPDLTEDYNFAQVGRVDRCITCHKGIDKVRVDPDRKVFDPWTGISRPEVTPLYTAENTPEKVFRTHSRPELFVSSVSKHTVTKFGCTVCHGGLGWGVNDFNAPYHTPNDEAQEKEWTTRLGFSAHAHREGWDFPMLPMKHIEASCFKCHRDPERMDPLAKMAREIPSAPRWNRGMRLFEQSGCFGCHKVDGWSVSGLDKGFAEIKDAHLRDEALAQSIRKAGPSLLRVPSKWVSKEAAFQWVWDPKSLRPTTRMPRFTGQPNNSGIDPLTGIDYDRRTRAEVWGIVEYLWAKPDAFDAKAPPVKGDPARGKELFGSRNTVGCVACHATRDFPVQGVAPNDHGPDLSTVGSKTTEKWFYSWLLDPEKYWHETRMPSLRLTPQEAADLAAYLASLRDPAWEEGAKALAARGEAGALEAIVKALAKEAARAASKGGDDPEAVVEAASPSERLQMAGKRAISRYGCFGCHEIRGFESAERIGTELGGGEGWGSKDVDRLDFGLLENEHAAHRYEKGWDARRIPHRKPDWARLKVLNPRVYDAGLTKQPDEKLRMPNFGFSPDDADALVTFLLSLQKGEIPPAKRRLLDSREQAVERMRWIARQYNCYGCHTMDRHDTLDAGGKLLPEEVRGGDVRPWIGMELADRGYWPPTLGGEGEAVVPHGTAPGGARRLIPGEGFKVRPDWLFEFLQDPGRRPLRSWLKIRMPTFPFTPEQANRVVHGFAAADQVPFPFEPRRKEDLLAGKDLADAKRMFDLLQCAKCHPEAGKPLKEGDEAIAPELTHGYSRLRYQWVALWLRDPKGLQPGTRMPAVWEHPSIDKEFYVPDTIKGFFGDDPHEQMRKLASYVLSLGAPKEE